MQPVLDIGPTLLNYDGLQPIRDMTGKDLCDTVANDPGQEPELQDPEVETRIAGQLSRLMTEAHAPAKLFQRFGL